VASFSDPPAGSVPAMVLASRWRREARDLLRHPEAARRLGAAVVALPLLGLAFARFGATGRFAVGAFFICALCLLSAIDIAERRLPNRIVLPSAAAVLVAQTLLFPDRALEWTVAALAAALVLLTPLLIYPDGIGMGDVKLALLLGFAVGRNVPLALFAGMLFGVVPSLVLFARHGAAARKMGIPFAPFLALGAVLALFAGKPLLHAYLHLF
jgi:leader peptidase (prepilin peptidase) / N-methyltransferase